MYPYEYTTGIMLYILVLAVGWEIINYRTHPSEQGNFDHSNKVIFRPQDVLGVAT